MKSETKNCQNCKEDFSIKFKCLSFLKRIDKKTRYYLIHKYFLHFYYEVFSVFGALLLYKKSGSIEFALIFLLLLYVLTSLIKSVFLKSILKSISKFKLSTVLFLGAFFMLSADILLLSIPFKFLYIVLLAVILKSIGTSIYMTISNSIEWNIIGTSNSPAKTASYFEILKLFVSLSIVGITSFLTLNGHFITVFLFSGMFIFFSLYPLIKMKLPPVRVFSFKEAKKQICLSAILANFNVDHQFVVTAIPLIIFLQFGSIEKSILVVSIALVANGFFSYFAGIIKHRNHKWLIWIAIFLSFLIWLIYGFANNVFVFVVLGILLGITGEIISNGREAKLGEDLCNTTDHVATAYIVEFYRSLGEFTGIALIILLYYITSTIPQLFLILVPIFTIPKIYYSLKPVRGL